MTTLSITRALAEVKLLDKRIQSAIEDLDPVQVSVVKLVQPSLNAQREQYLKDVRAAFQSIKALIERRDQIKAAIVLSNATTEVVIAGKTYTVAAAIEKKSSIAHERSLFSKLRSSLQYASHTLEKEGARYSERLDAFLGAQAQALGKSKTDAAWVEEQTTVYASMHEPVLVDPLDVKRLIPQMLNSIREFESEVDYILSESNAKTTIEVAD